MQPEAKPDANTEPTVYTIGQSKYRQARLVLGQVEHLSKVLAGVRFNIEQLDAAEILGVLGVKVPDAIACVLIPEGKTAGDVVDGLDAGNYAVTAALRRELPWDLALEIALDFFVCNPVTTVPVLVGRVNGLLDGMLSGAMNLMMLKRSTPSSAEATSASEPVSAAQ